MLSLETIHQPDFHRVVIARDPSTQYVGIIAVHDVSHGPALGGTRLRHYPSETDAVADALRLAEGMTLKSAFAALPFGGGKAAIMQPSIPFDRAALLESHGRAVEALGGAYVTAEDVGTTPEDLAHIGRATSFVLRLTQNSVDSAWATARGVFRSIEGAAMHRWGATELNERRVAVQGCGATGRELILTLRDRGAHVLAADVDSIRTEAVKRLGAEIVDPTEIARADCDVFSPCALGGVLDAASATALGAGIVVGSANNQLVTDDVAHTLHARGILYVPDFVANAGGVIAACVELLGWSKARVITRIDQIADDVRALCGEASRAGTTPLVAARMRIQERRTLTLPSG